jgi:hypothetical protein
MHDKKILNAYHRGETASNIPSDLKTNAGWPEDDYTEMLNQIKLEQDNNLPKCHRGG